MMGKYN